MLRSSVIPDRLVTTYLEMTSPHQLRAASVATQAVEIRTVRFESLAAYRKLYSEVGEIWQWRDRLLMPDAELAAALAVADVNVMSVEGDTAGYIELASDGAGNTEIAYFGLRPAYFGRGLGGYLLSYGVRRAWETGARRVWLHTCNLDGPAALPNYLARGFTASHTEDVPMPEKYKS